jgi:hypothetical protein
MAFEITNKTFAPTQAPGASGLLHYELYDEVAAGTLTDTGIAGLKHIRVRLMLKSGLTSTNTFKFRVVVDDAAAMGTPECVAYGQLKTFVTGDTYLTWDVYGWSQTGFRAFRILGTNSGGTAVYDAIVDCW